MKTLHVKGGADVSNRHDFEFTEKLEGSLLHVAGLSGAFYRGPWDRTDKSRPYIHTPCPEPATDPTAHISVAPPPELRHWYSLNSDADYLASGKKQAQMFRGAFESAFGPLQDGDAIIEIGCSAGRMVRWFEPEADRGAVVWGADIDAAAIMWAQENLPAKLGFFTNTTAPHLPFADGTFNLIFGGSLFTHIGELADAWFLEVRRLLRRDRSMAIITLNDEDTMQWHRERYPNPDKIPNQEMRRRIDMIARIRNEGARFGKFVIYSSPWQQSVWYSSEFIVPRLQRIFEVTRRPGFYGYQTGYLLKPR
jgi:SAM-dependent methyltransferase